MCETHSFGFDTPDCKYLHSLVIRLEGDVDSSCEVFIEYDKDGRWCKVANVSLSGATREIRVVPRRCDSFKVRICGKGRIALRSVTKSVEKINNQGIG